VLRRLAATSPAAGLAAALLLALMVMLAGVKADPVARVEREPSLLVVTADEPPPVRHLRELAEPQPYLAPPAVPSLLIEGADPAPLFEGVSVSPVVFDSDVMLLPMPVAMVAAPSTPVVRVPPAFPRQEAERGIEGVCWVSYDILATGVTANIEVQECDSPGFAQASVRAVERWRHEPSAQADNAERIIMAGIRTELVFVLNRK
jgi:periplasmic protein TonB